MHYRKSNSILFIIVLLLFLGCDQLKGPEKEIVGFDLNNIDTTVSPREDFYNFAVGNWIPYGWRIPVG